jgi:hypothetical protein
MCKCRKIELAGLKRVEVLGHPLKAGAYLPQKEWILI